MTKLYDVCELKCILPFEKIKCVRWMNWIDVCFTCMAVIFQGMGNSSRKTFQNKMIWKREPNKLELLLQDRQKMNTSGHSSKGWLFVHLWKLLVSITDWIHRTECHRVYFLKKKRTYDATIFTWLTQYIQTLNNSKRFALVISALTTCNEFHFMTFKCERIFVPTDWVNERVREWVSDWFRFYTNAFFV